MYSIFRSKKYNQINLSRKFYGKRKGNVEEAVKYYQDAINDIVTGHRINIHEINFRHYFNRSFALMTLNPAVFRIEAYNNCNHAELSLVNLNQSNMLPDKDMKIYSESLQFLKNTTMGYTNNHYIGSLETIKMFQYINNKGDLCYFVDETMGWSTIG